MQSLRELPGAQRGCRDIGLELHQEIVCYCATIHAQGVQTDTRVGLHRFQHVTRLISDRFQRRTG